MGVARMARPGGAVRNSTSATATGDMRSKRKEQHGGDVVGEDGAAFQSTEKRSKLNVSMSYEERGGGDDEEEEEVVVVGRVSSSVSGGGVVELGHHHHHHHNYNNNNINNNNSSNISNSSNTSNESSLSEMVQKILEARRPKGVRPLPVLLGEKDVDLGALNVRVSSMGGYSKVTEAGLWGAIADVLGLGLDCGPGLKLVYVKYLKALESGKAMQSAQNGVLSASEMDANHPSSSSHPPRHSGRLDCETGSSDREAEVAERHGNGDCSPAAEGGMQNNNNNNNNSSSRGASAGLSSDRVPWQQQQQKESEIVCLSDEEFSGSQRMRQHPECRQALTSEDWVSTYASVEHLARSPSGREEEGSVQAQGSEQLSDDWHEGIVEESRQVQRKLLSGMLEWIKRVALSPGTLSAGLGEEGSSQDEGWASQCHMLTAKVRSVLWKDLRAGDGYLQAKQMPSVFYDELVRPDSLAMERLRATRERLAYYGFQPLPGPSNRGASSHHDRNDGSYWGTSGAQGAQRSTRQPTSYSEMGNPRYQYTDRVPRKRIPIGPDFQADTFPCVLPNPLHIGSNAAEDGVDSDDEDDNDKRWLGVQVWPLLESSPLVNPSRIGRGRSPICDCSDPESMDCVKMHVQVAREELKVELGPAFYDMGFDRMGECVALQWSKEDEMTFRLLARTHPASSDKNFWDHLPLAFPSRTKRELVSYYFNVFVLRRRALQNRLDGQKIDSDDDEAELPDETDESDCASMDDDEDDEDDPSEGLDDIGSEDMHDAYPLKLVEDMGLGRLGQLSGYNYSSAGVMALQGGDSARVGCLAVGGLGEAENLQRHDDPDSSHMVLGWGDKPLEASVLQQGRHWPEPQWDVRDPQVSNVLSHSVSSRQSSPPTGREETRHSTHLELWSQHMEMAPKPEKDRLLSTNGMILELFGDDVRN